MILLTIRLIAAIAGADNSLVPRHKWIHISEGEMHYSSEKATEGAGPNCLGIAIVTDQSMARPLARNIGSNLLRYSFRNEPEDRRSETNY